MSPPGLRRFHLYADWSGNEHCFTQTLPIRSSVEICKPSGGIGLIAARGEQPWLYDIRRPGCESLTIGPGRAPGILLLASLIDGIEQAPPSQTSTCEDDISINPEWLGSLVNGPGMIYVSKAAGDNERHELSIQMPQHPYNGIGSVLLSVWNGLPQ